jgi:uncharacterized RDD family membrane protein YckC
MKNVHFAGFWIRFAASLIDGFLMSICAMILIVPMILVLGLSVDSVESYGNDDIDPQILGAIMLMYVVVFVISLACHWLYFALFESSARQATPGKMAVGVRVVGPQGERITFARASGRAFGKFLSGMICNIGYIMAGFTEYKQALHDMLATTYVVYKDDQPQAAQPYQTPPPGNGIA